MLVITTPVEKETRLMVISGLQATPVTISAVITDTDAALVNAKATLDWNDGSPAIVFPPGPMPFNVESTRSLRVGTYFITLTAYNFLSPNPQQLSSYFKVQIMPEQMVPVPQLYLFGPILPLDHGYPNTSQWNFNVSNDLDVLASSVKSLLVTAKGERINLPTYGTTLRRIVFEPNLDSITTTIKQEIQEALNNFEPRATLDSFSVDRPNPREVVVNANFLSKISQSTFSLSLPFSQ